MSPIIFQDCPFHEPQPGMYAKSLEINELSRKFRCHTCHAWGDMVLLDPASEPETGARKADFDVYYRLERQDLAH